GAFAWDFDQGDQLTGPFGRLVRGADGDFYPLGLASSVRAHFDPTAKTITVYKPDGTTWLFGGSGATVDGPSGTYAWHLVSVVDLLGRRTDLSWSSMNASGNLRLDKVSWGNVPLGPAQYQVTYDYESVTSPDTRGNAHARFVDYRSRAGVSLDQRIAKVHFGVLRPDTGTFAERWAWQLAYTQEPKAAVFYLSSVQRVFASGESEPAVTYTYRLESDTEASTSQHAVPELTALFSQLKVTPDTIQPAHAAVADVNHDGNPDLELGNATRTLVSQRGSGTAADPLHFEVENLPAAAPSCTTATQLNCTDRRCRVLPTVSGGTVPPRLLSELNPTDDTTYVVDLNYQMPVSTAVTVCSREGLRLSVENLTGNWGLSGMVHFVDVNRDHLPDLVKVTSGQVEVAPSVSDGHGGLTWGPHVVGKLLGASGAIVSPTAITVTDTNGDGLPDVLAQMPSSILAFYGRGDGSFTTAGQELDFVARSGQPLVSLSGYHVIPGDLNKDGLTDYFLTNASTSGGSFLLFFVNDGAKLVEAVVPAFDALPNGASQPVIATLDGTGNLAATVTEQGQAFSIPLDEPGTGLLSSADDGKGSRVDFTYARGPASPGIRHRCPLLASLTVTTSGTDPVTSAYRYTNPTIESQAKYLVGFDDVERDDGYVGDVPRTTTAVNFENGDDFSGLVHTQRVTQARSPDVVRYEETDYEDALFQNIHWRRPRLVSRGFLDTSGSLSSLVTTTNDLWDGLCPVQTTTTKLAGTLVTKVDLASPAKMAPFPHCLQAQTVEVGTHADATLNFTRTQQASYNDVGEVTLLQTLGDGAPLVRQNVTYDPQGRVALIATPGHGVATFGYDPITGILSTQTTAEGVVRSLTDIDPLTDVVRAIHTDRGGAAFDQFFRYDGQERLAKKWDTLGGASEALPNEAIQYAYATTNTPASIEVSTLIDAPKRVVRLDAQLAGGGAENIASLSLTDVGWVADGFVAHSHATGSSKTFRIRNVAMGTDPGTLDYASLLVGESGDPDLLTASDDAGFGYAADDQTRFHADVTRNVTRALRVDAGGGKLVREEILNDALDALVTLDADGKRVLARQDASGAVWTYAYDALDRLRAVILPDGSRHTAGFDAYGRSAGVRRDGVATVTYAYASAADGAPTDLIASRTYSSAPASGDPVPVRAVATTYDPIGRVAVETHTDAATGAQKVFTYFYDGAWPNGAAAPVAVRGVTSAVMGDGYTKEFVHRADGKPVVRTTAIADFQTLEVDIGYGDDATVRSETITVRDPAGAVLQSYVRHHDVDAYGRPAATTINGNPFATYSYEGHGLLARAAFTTGDEVDLSYDGLTRELVGIAQVPAAGGSWSGSSSYRFKRNPRGLTGDEWYGMGPAQTHRTLGYSARGFLEQSTDEAVVPDAGGAP
ncbi:MAG TPA: FG-GAP-like repeat-containing protein, partial [Polyangiaceae bacterium]